MRALITVASEADKAWLAAAIDGEGTIGLYNHYDTGRRPQISLTNSYLAFVEKALELTGVGSIIVRNYSKHTEGRYGKKTIYCWQVQYSPKILPILREIFPYLIIKRDKAQEILKEFEERPARYWSSERRLAASKRATKRWALRKSA